MKRYIIAIILLILIVASLSYIYQSNYNVNPNFTRPIETSPTKPIDSPETPTYPVDDNPKPIGGDNKPKSACYIGGCSGEICSDQEGVVSTCIYRAEYACYKTATCERQSSGQCGWTETPEFKMCLVEAEDASINPE